MSIVECTMILKEQFPIKSRALTNNIKSVCIRGSWVRSMRVGHQPHEDVQNEMTGCELNYSRVICHLGFLCTIRQGHSFALCLYWLSSTLHAQGAPGCLLSLGNAGSHSKVTGLARAPGQALGCVDKSHDKTETKALPLPSGHCHSALTTNL